MMRASIPVSSASIAASRRPLLASRKALVAQATTRLGAGALRQGPEPPQGGQRPAGSVAADAALPGHVVAEAEHLFFTDQRDERPVGAGVDYEEVERVRSEVDGRDPHVHLGG